MKIKITLNDAKVVTAKMEDNEAAKEFVALLPLTLNLKDYNSTEKISDLPKKLSKKGVPAAIVPSAGDIAYYAPWGNLAIFYREFGNSPGLIKLGAIDSGIEAFRKEDPIKAKIEIIR